MDVSNIAFRIEDLDQLLNELEQIAQSQSSRVKFYGALLERLRFVLSANGTAFAVPLDGQQWGVVAFSGRSDFRGYIDRSRGSRLGVHTTTSPAGADPEAHSFVGDDRFLETFVSPKQPNRGALIVELANLPDPAALEDIARLCQAFGEIVCVRQSYEMQEFLNRKLPLFQQLLTDLSQSQSTEQAATLIANDLLPVLAADRISLTQSTFLVGNRVLAVSNTITAESRSESLRAIQKVAGQVIESAKPVSKFMSAASVQSAPDSASLPTASTSPKTGASLSNSRPQESPIATRAGSDKTFGQADTLLAPNYICFPLGKSGAPPNSQQNPRTACDAAVLVEWNDYESLIQGATTLNSVVPTLDVIWLEQERWLRTPRLARAMADLQVRPKLASRTKRWLKAATGLLVLGLLALLLTRPYDLRIEMQGILEPESQRTIYAAQDGVVVQVLVRDSAQVHQGQLLLVMRSPALEIQIEEVLGELKANLEKRDALALNVNQIARDGSASPSNLNRLSAEIRQLETIRDSLELKQAFLREEEDRLKIVSPIDGIVVARELDKLLDSRPLRRGDALFRIVNPNDPWRLQLSIADSDVGYVKNQLFGDSPLSGTVISQDSRGTIDFVLTSKPDLRFQADIVWLADAARNPRGDGVLLDAIAEIEPQAMTHAYIGATVQAFMTCGQRPLWFVFSRPLVEAIQRKLWF